MDKSEKEVEESHKNEHGELADNQNNNDQSRNEQYLKLNIGATTTYVTLNTILEKKS